MKKQLVKSKCERFSKKIRQRSKTMRRDGKKTK